ncbi:MAG: ribonuclease HII [Candidatus Eisenbacteria bacterium]|nr:ribonuclease HII [Candidatus Eisenbacteria bacterium]
MRKALPPDRLGPPPSGRWEAALLKGGCLFVAGVDEVGRGCLAGPVVAAAVILKPGARIPGLRDSKILLARERRALIPKIRAARVSYGIGAVAPCGIDRWNIRRASFRAMRIALSRLDPLPEHALVDGFRIPRLGLAQTHLVRGDRRCRCIAAASVIAKVARDRRMDRYHLLYPQYLFHRNRGYATPAHLEALGRFGPSPLHRRSFEPVRRRIEGDLELPF